MRKNAAHTYTRLAQYTAALAVLSASLNLRGPRTREISSGGQ